MAGLPIRCGCGRLTGVLSARARPGPAICYCRDCQAFANALGKADEVLDPLGGTTVVPTLQQHVSFTGGIEALACLSLSPRGLLRWHSACCGTAIANTTRNPRLAYVGIVHTALGGREAVAAAFGPVRMAVNTQSARGVVKASAWRALLPTAGIIASVAAARLSGAWKRSPFFDAAGQPVAAPRVLSLAEKEKAYGRHQG